MEKWDHKKSCRLTEFYYYFRKVTVIIFQIALKLVVGETTKSIKTTMHTLFPIIVERPSFHFWRKRNSFVIAQSFILWLMFDFMILITLFMWLNYEDIDLSHYTLHYEPLKRRIQFYCYIFCSFVKMVSSCGSSTYQQSQCWNACWSINADEEMRLHWDFLFSIFLNNLIIIMFASTTSHIFL